MERAAAATAAAARRPATLRPLLLCAVLALCGALFYLFGGGSGESPAEIGARLAEAKAAGAAAAAQKAELKAASVEARAQSAQDSAVSAKAKAEGHAAAAIAELSAARAVAANATAAAANATAAAANATAAAASAASILSFWRRVARNLENLRLPLFKQAVPYKDHSFKILGEDVTIKDSALAIISPTVATELNRGDYLIAETTNVGVGDTVLDLGGNVGITAIVMAKKWPQARIVTVEPIPWSYSLALENVHRNNVSDRVDVVNAAISGRVPGSGPLQALDFSYSLRNTGASTSDPHFRAHNFDRPEIPGFLGNVELAVFPVTLDEIVEAFSVTRVPFIKLDCEGCEYSVLENLTPRGRAIFAGAVVVGETHHGSVGLLGNESGQADRRAYIDSFYTRIGGQQ